MSTRITQMWDLKHPVMSAPMGLHREICTVLGQAYFRATIMYKLDFKPYTDNVKQSRDLADRVLARYGNPTRSVEELRFTLDRELDAILLSELIIQERKCRKAPSQVP